LKVGTINVAGIDGKEAEIVQLLGQEPMDILALTETWSAGMGSYLCGVSTHKILSLGASRSSRGGRNKGGCALLVATRFNAKQVEDEDNSPELGNILWVRLKARRRRDLFVCVVYGPQATDPREKRDAFYQCLFEQTLKYRRQGDVIVLGDFNARVDCSHEGNGAPIGQHGDARDNANGPLFREWLKNSHMFVGNGRRHEDGVFTRIYRGAKSVIDYIVLSRELFDDMVKTRVLEDYDMGSDHKPVITEISYRGLVSSRAKREKRLKSWRLRDEEVRKQYQEKLSVRLDEWAQSVPRLSSLADGPREEALWDGWKKCVDQAASEVLGWTSGSRHFLKPWWNQEVKDAIKERRRQYTLVKELPRDQWGDYYEAARAVKAAVGRAKREAWQSLMKEIEETRSSDSRAFYRLIRRFDSGRKRVRSNALDIEEAARHFESLGRAEEDDDPNTVDIPEGSALPPSEEEVRRALISLPRGKAVSDHMSVELLKDGGEPIVQSLKTLFGEFFHMERVNRDFVTGTIVPIHKEGSVQQATNYRGITLSNVVGKCYSKTVGNKFSPQLEDGVIHDEQGGFRVERACDEQVFLLHSFLAQRKALGLITYLLFVDFKKAFDSVSRKRLFEKMVSIGVDGKVIRAIRSLYQGHSARVRVDGNLSREFSVELGVKQGCVMSTELFKVFVNDLIEKLRAADCAVGNSATVRSAAVMLSCLMFADDLVIVADTQRQLQLLADILKEWCEDNALRVNASKTKVMVVGPRGHKAKINLAGTTLEVVKEYKYLGMILSNDLSWNKHVSYVLGKMKKRIGEFSFLFGNNGLSVGARLQVYRCLVLSVITYGAGVWQMTDHQLRQLELAHRAALKRILKTSRTTTTAAVLADTGMLSVERLMEESVLKFAGRLKRMDQSRLVHQQFNATLEDPRHPWTRRLKRLLNLYELGESWQGAAELSKSQWNKLVKATVHHHFADELGTSLASAVKCSTITPTVTEGKLRSARYLSQLSGKLGSFLFKLRAGSLRLAIEEGRIQKVERHERLCPLCGEEVEDTSHFVLRCPRLQEERHSLSISLSSPLSQEEHFYPTSLSSLTRVDHEPLTSPFDTARSSPDTSELSRTLSFLLDSTPPHRSPSTAWMVLVASAIHSMWVKRCTLLHSGSQSHSPVYSNNIAHIDTHTDNNTNTYSNASQTNLNTNTHLNNNTIYTADHPCRVNALTARPSS
jgi:exonuclease III